MTSVHKRRHDFPRTHAALALPVLCAFLFPAQILIADGGSPGPLAQTCGVPAADATAGRAGRGAVPPTFAPGQHPVKLPAVSLLGARNDLQNPYRPGMSWGDLPNGRKWGSTASVSSAPDGTLWVVDRCGHSGSSGTTCGGESANIYPVFQFDKSGKLL